MKNIVLFLLFSIFSYSQDYEIEDKRGSNNSSGGIFDNGQGNQQGNGNGGNGNHYGWETPPANIDSSIFILFILGTVLIYRFSYENNTQDI